MKFLRLWHKRKKGSAKSWELHRRLRYLPQLPIDIVNVIVHCLAAEIAQRPEEGLETCSACALDDLARCARINRLWHREATPLLYTLIDLDVAHNCERAATSMICVKGKANDSVKSPPLRLQLFLRTSNENQQLAKHVVVLKAASVRDDASFSNLARLVRGLHQLREIDLPAAFYKATGSTLMLRRELEANCSEIRSTIYCSGAERHFNSLICRDLWPNLEALELSHLPVDVVTIRSALSRLKRLRVLKLSQMAVGDALFTRLQDVPCIPPLQELHIEDDRGVTYAGMSLYLNDRRTTEALKSISFIRTKISVLDVQRLIATATNLEHLTLTQEVDCSLYVHLLSLCPPQTMEYQPPITSGSLKTLTFDISPSRKCSWPDARSYYDYLLPSIQGNLLPNLCKVLVLDADFVSRLLHPRSLPPLQLPHSTGLQTVTARAKPLEIYTKGSSELPWSSATRAMYYMSGVDSRFDLPVDASGIGRSASPWTGGARKSVLLSNGVGQFSPIPQLPADFDSVEGLKSVQPRNTFIATQRVDDIGRAGDRRSRMDLWR